MLEDMVREGESGMVQRGESVRSSRGVVSGESTPWRVIPLERRHPSVIAAMEEVLLGGPNTIVFHEWEPSFSIASMQSLDDLNVERCEKFGIPIVRTTVGGRAVYHDAEFSLSYCIALKPESLPVGVESPQRVYEFLLGRVVEGLVAVGVPAELFDKHYIRAGGKKVSGNALRITRDGVILHGSLLFDIPDVSIFVSRMLDFVNTRGERPQWHADMSALLSSVRAYNPEVSREAVCTAITRAFTSEYSSGGLSFEEKKRVQTLAATKYATPEVKVNAQPRGLCWRKYGVPPSETRGVSG